MQAIYKTETGRGFSMVEVVVSIAIITLLTGSIVTLQRNIFMNSKVLQSSMIAQHQVRKTLEGFSSEVRSATMSAGGAYAIESAGTSSIVFFSNIDIDASIERVRYFYATSSNTGSTYTVLKKGVTKPVGTLYNPANEQISTVMLDVKNGTSTPIFTYFDSSYNGTASSTAPLVQPVSIPSIRLIKIFVAVDPNAARSPVYQTYSTQVSVRNLKDNL